MTPCLCGVASPGPSNQRMVDDVYRRLHCDSRRNGFRWPSSVTLVAHVVATKLAVRLGARAASTFAQCVSACGTGQLTIPDAGTARMH